MCNPYFVKMEKRVSPSSIVLLIDFKEVISGTKNRFLFENIYQRLMLY